MLHNHYCLLQVHYLEEKQKAPLASRLSRGGEYFWFYLIWWKKEIGSVQLSIFKLSIWKECKIHPIGVKRQGPKVFVSYLSKSNYVWTACMTLVPSPGLLTLVSSVQAGSNRDPYMLLHCSWKKEQGVSTKSCYKCYIVPRRGDRTPKFLWLFPHELHQVEQTSTMGSKCFKDSFLECYSKMAETAT